MSNKRIKIVSFADEDKGIDIYVGDKYIKNFNHDVHGWTGISEAKELVEKLAKELGLEIIHEEEE
ncbi:hypothetical protein ACTOJ1_000341 [Shigella flexneri]